MAKKYWWRSFFTSDISVSSLQVATNVRLLRDRLFTTQKGSLMWGEKNTLWKDLSEIQPRAPGQQVFKHKVRRALFPVVWFLTCLRFSGFPNYLQYLIRYLSPGRFFNEKILVIWWYFNPQWNNDFRWGFAVGIGKIDQLLSGWFYILSCT